MTSQADARSTAGTPGSASTELLAELRELAIFHELLIKQLHNVIAQTENAAVEISTRIQEANALLGEDRGPLAQILENALAGVQFQDITRQQIEQVIRGIGLVDRHTQALADRFDSLASDTTARMDIPPLKEILEQFYSNYVMEQQRDIHHQVLGRPQTATGKAPNDSKTELF